MILKAPRIEIRVKSLDVKFRPIDDLITLGLVLANKITSQENN